MFERFTERARRILFFARYEASQLGSSTIETDHLLLGLIHENKGLTASLFARAQVPLTDIRAAIAARAKGRDRISTSVEIPFTAETKRVLQHAAQEADRLLHNFIGAEHLLLGILREDASETAALLKQHGLRIEAVREDIVHLLNEKSATVQDEPQAIAAIESSSGSSSFLELRITPAAAGVHGSTTGGPGSWVAAACDLRTLLSTIYDSPMARIELPSRLDKGEKYDFSIRYSPDPGTSVRNRLLLAWIETHFRIAVARAPRAMGVYVLTAPEGLNHSVKEVATDGGGIAAGSVSMELPAGDTAGLIGAISAAGMTIAEFGQLLEQGLDRFVVDETGLNGRYEFQLTGETTGTDEFRERLRNQLGLVLTPAHRDVMMLVVRSADGT